MAGLSAPATAQQSMFIPGAGSVHVNVASMSEERFANIVRQSTDYSCGAAAVATILRYAYDVPATEDDTIRGMLHVSDMNVVRQRGFSLLDIKHYVTSIGYIGSGYKLTMDALYEIRVPSIILLNIDGYDHFVVLKRAQPDYVYVADPMLGNRRIETPKFASTWNGIIFVIAATSYNAKTSLLALDEPLPLDVMSNSIPSASLALDNAQLMLIYIPAMTRI